MINVNQITAQLARMPDQALQQFAAMHKNDPYTVSLALSESNRRKQMRTAAQMPQGGEPPKVVDQGIAEMAPPAAQPMPEDVGIGQLPAGNMNFAEGGIVGYADGGVPRYADEGLVRLPNESFADFRRRTFDMELKRQREANLATEQAREAERIRLLAERGDSNTVPPSPFFERASLPSLVGATVPATPSPTDPNFRRAVTPGAMASMPSAAEQMRAQNAPVADTGQGAGPGTGTGIDRLLAPRAAGTGIAAAVPAGPGDFMSRYEAARKDRKVKDPFAAEEKELQESEKAATAKRLAEFDADVAARGDARAGQKERLSKREAELGKEKNRTEGLALLEAGLAMMQSKGRGLSGIAAGAGVGVKAYASGIEKLKTAQEKLDEARDKIDEAQDTENQLTKKERRALLADADKTTLQGKRAYLAAQRALLTKDEALIQTATASDIATQRAREQQRSTENIAAQNRAALAGRAETAGGRLDLATLKAQQQNIEARLKATTNAKDRAALQQELKNIGILLAGGTIPAPSAAAAPGGTASGKTIDFMTGKPI